MIKDYFKGQKVHIYRGLLQCYMNVLLIDMNDHMVLIDNDGTPTMIPMDCISSIDLVS